MQGDDSSHVVRFGIFEIDLRARELRRQGVKVKLQEQPFHVLAMLLERPGQVVTRQELRERIWPSGIFVEYDKSLSKAVNKVRAALGDSPENSRFIETLAKRGYRFLVPVEFVQAPQPAVPVAIPRAESAAPSSLRAHRRGTVVGIFASLSVAIIVLISLSNRQPVRESERSGLIAVPLTTYSGFQFRPEFSPDGNHVAFSWDGLKQDNLDVYVKPNGTENLIRLTYDPAPDYAAAWSPDGKWIAFLRNTPGGRSAVIMIPALGGPPERMLTENSRVVENPKVGAALEGLSWSPDGKWLAMSGRAPGEPHQSLFLFCIQTGEKRRLTFPPARCGDGTPAFSPDGRTLAFSRSLTLGVSEIFTLDLTQELLPKRAPQQLTFKKEWAVGLAWTPDGKEIVYSAGSDMESAPANMWRVSADRASGPRLLAFAGPQGRWPTISRRGHRLAFALPHANDQNIWRLDLSRSNGRAGEAAKLIGSSRNDLVPQYSPDGKRIVFISQRGGGDDVWVCNSDGSGAVQLTSMRAATVGSPRWSPDGAKIVFDSNASGTWDVYVIDSNGGRPTRLTDHPANDGMASFSRDGRFIYFVSDRGNAWELWKMPADGGEPAPVTTNGGYVAFESIDGTSLYYAKRSTETSLWSRPIAGGSETKLIDPMYGIGFVVRENGIYFIRPPEPGGSPTLRFLSFNTGAIKTIAALPRLVNLGLSISPDGQYALFTQEDRVAGNDLMVVENFK